MIRKHREGETEEKKQREAREEKCHQRIGCVGWNRKRYGQRVSCESAATKVSYSRRVREGGRRGWGKWPDEHPGKWGGGDMGLGTVTSTQTREKQNFDSTSCREWTS